MRYGYLWTIGRNHKTRSQSKEREYDKKRIVQVLSTRVGLELFVVRQCCVDAPAVERCRLQGTIRPFLGPWCWVFRQEAQDTRNLSKILTDHYGFCWRCEVTKEAIVCFVPRYHGQRGSYACSLLLLDRDLDLMPSERKSLDRMSSAVHPRRVSSPTNLQDPKI